MTKLEEFKQKYPIWDSLPGWSGSFLQCYDIAIVEAKNGDTIIEVGVAFGKSLAYLYLQAKDSGKKIKIVGIDSWVKEYWDIFAQEHPETYYSPERYESPYAAFEQTINSICPEMLLDEDITIIKGENRVKSSLFADGSLHCVMIDADHSYEGVKADIETWLPKLKKDGILCGDDYTTQFPGVVQAVNEVFGTAVRSQGYCDWWIRI